MSVTNKTDYVLIGYGIVGAGVLHYLKGTIVVIDKQKREIPVSSDRNVIFIEEAISGTNYQDLLSQHSQPGTIVIEAAVETDTKELSAWCHHNGRHFINTVGDAWLPETLKLTNNYQNIDGIMNVYIDRLIPNLTESGPTCLLTHGANPGMVNHYLNLAIHELAASKQQSFADIVEQIEEVYVLEKDTLMFRKDFQPEEGIFYNTWNILEFFLESIAHTDYPDANGISAYNHAKSKQIVLDHVTIHGRIVSHEETFSMQHYLKSRFNKNCKIQFIYECSPVGELSRTKWKFGEDYQPKCATHELDADYGFDLVGTIVVLKDKSNWFSGYSMNQKEAANAFQHTNATAWYVSASVLAAIDWLKENPDRGLVFPEMIGAKDSMQIIEYFRKYSSGKNLVSTSIKNLFISDDYDTYECINLKKQAAEKIVDIHEVKTAVSG